MDAAQLATRFLLGYTFIFTGWGKLQHFDNTVAFFSDLGIPFASANAAFVASLEFVGGMMLLLGLGTRAVAFLLSSTMLVALLTAEGSTLLDALARENNVALSDVTPLVFLVFLGWLMATGPGRLSVDSRVARAFSIHR
jgi:putative oxidoreductase